MTTTTLPTGTGVVSSYTYDNADRLNAVSFCSPSDQGWVRTDQALAIGLAIGVSLGLDVNQLLGGEG